LTCSVLAASATAAWVFVAGHTLQGLSTSLLLIAAVPPLIVGYPAAKMRSIVMIMNICGFGAVALGPVVGGIQASTHHWRPLFWIVAGIALAALVLSPLTFQDVPPADRSAPRDPLAVGLAASGCVAAFFGASELLTHRFLDALTFGPLIVGRLEPGRIQQFLQPAPRTPVVVLPQREHLLDLGGATERGVFGGPPCSSSAASAAATSRLASSGARCFLGSSYQRYASRS
jgi:hypothetical protein